MTRLTLSLLAAVPVAAALMFAAGVAPGPAKSDPVGADRPCQGPVTTLAWGAWVGDAAGRCTPAAAPRVEARVVTAVRVETAPTPCADERRHLGGAVVICPGPTRAERSR